jgi:hypothetical protein
MSDSEVTLPKNVVASAVTIIFLHWSGASFASGKTASTWLGALQIERGWVIGVFLHLWFVSSYLLYWQKKNAPKLRDLETEHRQMQHIELFHNIDGFPELFQAACQSSNSVVAEKFEQDISEITEKVLKRSFAVRSKNQTLRMFPTIRRKGFKDYFVDFSEPGAIFSHGSGSPNDGPSIESLPKLAVSREFGSRLLWCE